MVDGGVHVAGTVTWSLPPVVPPVAALNVNTSVLPVEEAATPLFELTSCECRAIVPDPFADTTFTDGDTASVPVVIVVVLVASLAVNVSVPTVAGATT